jgi:hypothetical protein
VVVHVCVAWFFFGSKLVTLGWTKQQRIYSVKDALGGWGNLLRHPPHSSLAAANTPRHLAGVDQHLVLGTASDQQAEELVDYVTREPATSGPAD